MNYTLFNKRWFIKHQKILLFLLNTPLIKRWFRKKLYINVQDELFAIHPNAIYLERGEEMQAIFSSHNRYSKSISLRFKYLWLTIHAWDKLVNFVQDMGYSPIRALNYGFDSLTVYPNADNTAPTDGFFKNEETNATWATIRGAAASDSVNVSSHDYYYQIGLKAGTNPPQRWNEMLRAYYGFDTSAMGAGASISAAVFSLCAGDGKSCNFNNASYYPGLSVCEYTGEDPATTADYDQFNDTSFADKSYADYDTSTGNTRNEFTLDSNGRANIDPADKSYFGLRLDIDVSNSEPSWTQFDANDYAKYYPRAADASGTDNDPKLVVTYTPVAGSASKRLLRGFGL